MTLSTDVAAGVLDICLGIVASLMLAVQVSRQRRRARSAAESNENGAQRFVGDRGIAPGKSRVP